MNIWIVIPAFNEEHKLGDVIHGLKKQGYNNIIVIDDGSKDKTYSIAKENNVDALRHIINRGQGAALKTGIDYALTKNAEIIITFDSDGQHQPEDIPHLIKPIQEGITDIVLGSRFLTQNSNVPFIRKIFLKGGAVIFRIMYQVKLTDSHNGLRALSRKAAETINLSQDKMEHASEIIEEISNKKLRYIEIPVTIKYTNYSIQHGQKTSNAFRILWGIFFNKLVKK